jgi:hypothetical protein
MASDEQAACTDMGEGLHRISQRIRFKERQCSINHHHI